MGRFPELVALVGLAVTEVQAAPRSAADCDALVRAAPRALASYRCDCRPRDQTAMRAG